MTYSKGIQLSVAAALCLSLLTACTTASDNEPGADQTPSDTDHQQTLPEAHEEAPQSETPPASRRDELSAPHEREHRELRDTILRAGTQRDADNIEHCKVLPFGHSPCGGAESYLVYSDQNLSDDEHAKLRDDAKRFNELDRIIKSARQIVGTCEVRPEPTVQLLDNRCVARQR